MQDDVLEIRTADNVGIGYEPAGLGSRILAFLVDLGIIGLVGLVVAVFIAAAFPDSPTIAALIIGGADFFVFNLYFVVAEATSGGRTPGKRTLHIRVVRIDGGAPGLTEAAVRGAARIVDLLVGIVPMFATTQARRLGDFAAGTLVVRERRALATPPPSPPIMLRTPDAGPAIDGLGHLGPAEAAALRTFLSRTEITPEQRSRIARQIAATLLDRMQLPASAPERQWAAELLLERLYMQLTLRAVGPR